MPTKVLPTDMLVDIAGSSKWVGNLTKLCPVTYMCETH